MTQLVNAMCQRVVNLKSLNNTIQYTILLILGACACLSHAWHLGPQLQVISLGLVAQLMPHDLGLRMSYMSYAPLGLASTGHTICMPNTSTLANHILLGHSKSRLLGNQLATDRPRQLNPPRSPEPSSACLRSETSLRALNGRRGSPSDPGPRICRFSGRKEAATEQSGGALWVWSQFPSLKHDMLISIDSHCIRDNDYLQDHNSIAPGSTRRHHTFAIRSCCQLSSKPQLSQV